MDEDRVPGGRRVRQILAPLRGPRSTTRSDRSRGLTRLCDEGHVKRATAWPSLEDSLRPRHPWYSSLMDRPLYDAQGRYIVPRTRRRRVEKPTESRFLTFSCYNRLPLFQNDAVKDRFALHLDETRQAFGFRLIAWVIMPEHVHLLVLPELPESPVPPILQYLKQRHARDILSRWRQIDAPVLHRLTDSRGETRFWQRGGGYDRNIRSRKELNEKIKYIHENPIRRGLVARATDWIWSSARSYAEFASSGPEIDRMD